MTEYPYIGLSGYNIFTGEKDFFTGDFKGVVNTISPHSYIVARKDALFREALMASDFIIPDGVGIIMAVRFLYRVKIRRLSGSELHEAILNSLDKKNGSCFYLGSSDQTLEIIKARVNREHPSIRAGSFSPPFKNVFSEDENTLMIKAVNELKPDVLFVGMTAPKQEKWVHENKENINAPLICSIGAVFDFYAGTVQRSGQFWIRMGLEWLPRLLREPRRLWKRNFVSTPLFLWHVLLEKGRLIFMGRRRGEM